MALEHDIAGRYLLRLEARGMRLHLITLVLAAIAAIGEATAFGLARSALKSPFAYWLLGAAHWVALGGLLAAVLIGFLVLLLRHFTIFTAISTFGLFLGSAALVVVLSVMSGFEQDLKHKILGANAHVTVTSPDKPFTDYRPVADRIRAAAPQAKVAPYISNEVMISSQSNLSGVVLKGIDPRSIGEVTDLGRNMELGSLDNLEHPEKLRTIVPPDFDDDDPDVDLLPKAPPKKKEVGSGAGKAIKGETAGGNENGSGNEIEVGKENGGAAAKTSPKGKGVDFVPVGPDGKKLAKPRDMPGPDRKILPGVVIGRELAKNLRVYVGDDVNVISPMGDIGPAGPMPRSRAFRVAGIFYSGMYEYDTKYMYMTIAAAQKFLGTDDEITGFEMHLPDADATQPVVDRLRATLGSDYDVQDWKELNRNLFSALKVEKVAMFIVLCFIILVAGFSIIANGIMLVREKRREIAILKSMGATDSRILKAFLFIGVYMGVVGVFAGILTGVLACLFLSRFGISLDTEVYYISKLPVKMNPVEIVAVFVAAMGIVLGATLYPAMAAARLRPVEGLRYDQG